MNGDYIRQQRNKFGLSQPQLAALISTDPTTVSRWERGIVDVGPENEEKLRALFSAKAKPPRFKEGDEVCLTSGAATGTRTRGWVHRQPDGSQYFGDQYLVWCVLRGASGLLPFPESRLEPASTDE